MKIHLTCPKCNYKWSYGYWEWVWKAPCHVFNFFIWKDKRRTKCPICNTINWIYKD